MKVDFTADAKIDLIDIAIYIAQGNRERALSFVDELESKCLKLGLTKGIGAPRPELGEGIRMLPHDRYLIFYREAEDALKIVRILHSARDRDNLVL